MTGKNFLLCVSGFGIGYIVSDALPSHPVLAILLITVVCATVGLISGHLDDLGNNKSGTGLKTGNE